MYIIIYSHKLLILATSFMSKSNAIRYYTVYNTLN